MAKSETVDISWLLKSLSMATLLARLQLEALWMYVQHKVPRTEVDFMNLFMYLGKSSYLYSILRLRPIADDEQKKRLAEIMDAVMSNKATHQLLYERIKDELVEQLKTACEQAIGYFEDPANIGDRLNVEDDRAESGEDHPLDELLNRRDAIAWVLIGIRMMQADDRYISVDIAEYERRLKIADMTLKRKVLVCVTYHYKTFRETLPFAPEEFWWRNLPGYEYRPEE